jgi:hypothetical protein
VLTSYRARISRIPFCNDTTSPDGINVSSGRFGSSWDILLRTLPSKALILYKLFQKSPRVINPLNNHLAKLLSLRQEELILRPQELILMGSIGIFFLQLLDNVPWRNGHWSIKKGEPDQTWAHLSPAISSRTEPGTASCREEDGDSLPVC